LITIKNKYPAILESEQDNYLYSEISGYIKEINCHIGQTVSPGQVLMTLQHIIPGYEPIKIKSQIHGQIFSLSVKVGTQIKQGDLLANIVNPEKLLAHIEVPAEERQLFKIGSLGILSFSTQKENIEVEVKNIAPQVNRDTGTISMKLNLNNENSLVPGLLGVEEFEFSKNTGILIPQKAVAYERMKTIVRVIKNDVVTKVEVKLGDKNINNTVEVLSGLQPGDTVVTHSNKYLKTGDKVIIESIN
ncbi:MAG: efflux RND transporter periplasmic adaptor subunit, partial [Romboutsia sp.]|nr:efflux RND transporter periplasmic adaptor subunit [Romboutsia sp.]